MKLSVFIITFRIVLVPMQWCIILNPIPRSEYLKENRRSSSLQLNLKKWCEYEISCLFVCMRSLLYYTQMCCILEWSYLLLENPCFLEGIPSLFPFFIFLFFHSLLKMFSISHLKASLWERPENGNISVAISFLYDLNKSWGKKSFFAKCKSWNLGK